MARTIVSLPNTEPADATNPYGRVRNETSQGAEDGTPVTEEMVGDALVFFQNLLDAANITANGQREDAVNGFQYLQALLQVTVFNDAGGDLDGNYPNPDIADDAVVTAKIADDAVTTDKIADQNVTTQKIDDEGVTTAKIADDAVVTAKIADQNVTTPKIDDEGVTTPKIADEAVTNAKIADDTITGAKVAPTNWINIPLINGWGGGGATVEYKFDVAGNVHIRGDIGGSTNLGTSNFFANTPAAIVPPGGRDVYQATFYNSGNFKTGMILVDASGLRLILVDGDSFGSVVSAGDFHMVYRVD